MVESIYKKALAKPIDNNENSVSILEWIIQQIDLSHDKTIRMKFKDLKSAIGPEFQDKNDGTLCEGLKRVLMSNGINVRSKTHKEDRSQLLIMYPINYRRDKIKYDNRERSLYIDALTNNMVTTDDGNTVSILEWIRQEIDKSPKKLSIVDTKYFKTILGPSFKDANHTAIYMSIRDALKKYNINTRRISYFYGNVIMTMSPSIDEEPTANNQQP